MSPVDTSPDPTTSAILTTLRESTDGLSQQELITRLNKLLSKPIAKRTLLRRLASLRDESRVEVQGAGRATRYTVPERADQRDDRLKADEAYPPLSKNGEAARERVRRPKSERTPVGYNSAFLRDYQPNSNAYLSEAMRAHLHTVGRTPEAARPAGTFARHIFERLLIDLSWSSSRLEGNTYSLLDTKNLLEKGQRADGKNAEEAQMILNHKKAVELLVDRAEDLGFNAFTLRNLHAALSENLLDDPNDEGRLRRRPVEISGSTYVPTAIPQLIEEMFDVFLTRASAIEDPFEQSFFAMVHLPYLQPFVDVNKRTSRLAANIPLIKKNFCPLSFIDVPETAYVEGTLAVYEEMDFYLLRDVFIWAYERSAQQYRVVRDSVHQPDPVRLRYRTELTQVIQEIILNGHSPAHNRLIGLARQFGVREGEREHFVEVAKSIFSALHEGALYRYGITQAQYASWLARTADSDAQ
jgi:hypothetical protein